MKNKILINLVMIIIISIILNLNNVILATTSITIDTYGELGKETITSLLVVGERSETLEIIDDEPTNRSSADKATLQDIIDNANKFLFRGAIQDENLSTESLNILSDSIYNILFVIGMFAAIIVGVILGIKFVTSGIEGKVEVKKTLIPYIIGCVVVFGSFTIWKIVIIMLQG